MLKNIHASTLADIYASIGLRLKTSIQVQKTFMQVRLKTLIMQVQKTFMQVLLEKIRQLQKTFMQVRIKIFMQVQKNKNGERKEGRMPREGGEGRREWRRKE